MAGTKGADSLRTRQGAVSLPGHEVAGTKGADSLRTRQGAVSLPGHEVAGTEGADKPDTGKPAPSGGALPGTATSPCLRQRERSQLAADRGKWPGHDVAGTKGANYVSRWSSVAICLM